MDSAGDVYVSDTEKMQIFKLSPAGRLLATIGEAGSAPGQFSWPDLVRVDGQGNIDVAEFQPLLLGHSAPGRIQKLSPDGKPLAQWPYDDVDGLAVDAKGNIYVSDFKNEVIDKLSPTGALLAQWSGSGPFHLVAPKGLAVDAQGNVYVVDSGDIAHQRIVKFTANGEGVAAWGRPPTVSCSPTTCTMTQPPEFQILSNVAVDSKGDIYAVENGGGRVVKLSPSGQHLAEWGTTGQQPGQFFAPYDIAIDSQGNVYITEPTPLGGQPGNDRVQKFSPTGQLLAVWR